MARPTVALSDFDPQVITSFDIDTSDLNNVFRYMQAMQGHLDKGTWDEICIGGYYGTSALLHEVVELRILLSFDAYLLTRWDNEIKAFARQNDNYMAHILGLEAEYRYLQAVVQRVFSKEVNIGALLQANSHRGGDWDDLFETTLPFFEPTQHEIDEADVMLRQLRQTKMADL